MILDFDDGQLKKLYVEFEQREDQVSMCIAYQDRRGDLVASPWVHLTRVQAYTLAQKILNGVDGV